MARAIVTKQGVIDAVEALLQKGTEPTVIAVQQWLGGGSFTTVKRELDEWKAEREAGTNAVAETPAVVMSQAQEFASAVWAAASGEARREVKKAREDAHTEVTSIRKQLDEATGEVSRLEALESEHAQTIETLASQLNAAQSKLIEAETEARRIPELEKALEKARADAGDAIKLQVEVDVLKRQTSELLAAIRPPGQSA